MSGLIQEWFSTWELANLGLRGFPGTKRGWNLLAQEGAWEHRADDAGRSLSRLRGGRGGPREFHWSLLPSPARAEMVRRNIVVERITEPAAIVAVPCWDSATDTARARAKERLAAVQDVSAMMAGGSNRDHAVSVVALRRNVGRSSVYGWLAKVSGEPKSSWLELLLDGMKGGGRKADIQPQLWQYYESWWLRQSEPTHADTYRRTLDEAKRLGIQFVPSAKTFQRRAEEIPAEIVAVKRGGPETARLLVPAIERTVDGMHALDLVNADGHEWDIKVRFADGTVGRPITVAVQDVYSRKFLSWRHGKSESAAQVRLAFVDLFRNWGFPKRVLLDNGRANASKWITGGAKNRYRYSIRDDDPLGLIPRFGIDVQWALPRRGSSKPIERGFGDFAKTIARHAAFDGAWLGNSVANKPENYGSRVVEWDDFVRVIDREIHLHNSRQGRDTEAAAGRSFDETFAESYQQVPITRATETQQRDCLLSAEKVRGERKTGAVRFMGNRYWSPRMVDLAGKPLIIHYDPADLHSEIHVYDARGVFVLTAPIWEKSGFLTEDHGRARMKVERDLVKNARDAANLRGLLTAQELAHRAALAAKDDDDGDRPSPTVIRPVRTRGVAAVAVKSVAEEPARDQAFMERYAAAVARRHLRLIEDE